MKYLAALLMVGALVSPPAANADVKSSGAHSFTVEQSVVVQVPPARAWSAFGKVGNWWSAEHSFSKKASNLSLELAPGGCWCEALPGGGVQFMRVTIARPPEELVLAGSLGPMLYDSAPGTMIVRFKSVGQDTQVTMTYKATGFADGDANKIAPLVDAVLGEQLIRFRDSLGRDD